MKKINAAWLICLVLIVLIVSLAVGCGKNAGAVQNPSPADTPKPTQSSGKPVVLKQGGIEGRLFLAPEARGKLELVLGGITPFNPAWNSTTPAIAVTIKNISDKPLKISSSESFAGYNQFFIRVLSKDSGGKILKEGGLGLPLQPKEVTSENIHLFPSDETRIVEVRLEYKHPPAIKVNYSKSPDAEGKMELRYEVSAYENPYTGATDLRLYIFLTNISSNKINSIVYSRNGFWLLWARFSAKGKEISGSGNAFANFLPLNPGETKKSYLPVQEGAEEIDLFLGIRKY